MLRRQIFCCLRSAFAPAAFAVVSAGFVASVAVSAAGIRFAVVFPYVSTAWHPSFDCFIAAGVKFAVEALSTTLPSVMSFAGSLACVSCDAATASFSCEGCGSVFWGQGVVLSSRP